MARESRVRRDKHGIPDPLHIELPHGHKRLLEAIYICVVIGTIVLLLVLGSIKVMGVDEANTSAMLVLMLSVFLGILIFEKSMISHRPAKSSS